ncbi:hypothetical protein EV421DRAFT_1906334 [Armillaria borealis]|uniref:Uncharacterized protein n=1 Tax=Armillaria borealis TaxID=47425 RepID=A0AA39JE96_9AGAR|nr:hypothetical protein EV421DRAFT_1906334 [Armillaria borealis]
MALEQWSGHLHGIGSDFLHRWLELMVVHCLACPEPGINMEAIWCETPLLYCHLIQKCWMLNGNMHTNKNKKNMDTNDVSLVGGHAFFPDQEHYREVAAQVMAMVEEVCPRGKCVSHSVNEAGNGHS